MGMKLKLIDVKNNTYEAETGTCDLCLGTETVSEDTFVFKVSDGNKDNEKIVSVKGYQ